MSSQSRCTSESSTTALTTSVAGGSCAIVYGALVESEPSSTVIRDDSESTPYGSPNVWLRVNSLPVLCWNVPNGSPMPETEKGLSGRYFRVPKVGDFEGIGVGEAVGVPDAGGHVGTLDGRVVVGALVGAEKLGAGVGMLDAGGRVDTSDGRDVGALVGAEPLGASVGVLDAGGRVGTLDGRDVAGALVGAEPLGAGVGLDEAGAIMGAIVGVAVGERVAGEAEGAELGGSVEGRTEGALDGLVVAGGELGAPEGEALDGPFVGDAVGSEFVGARVGDSLGFTYHVNSPPPAGTGAAVSETRPTMTAESVLRCTQSWQASLQSVAM